MVVLNILTIFGYSWVWFYKNWRDLKEFANTASEDEIQQVAALPQQQKTLLYLSKMNVFIHAMALLMPYFQAFFAAILFRQISELYPRRDSILGKNPVFTAIILTAITWLFTYAAERDGICRLLFLVAIIPQVVAQKMLNQFWLEVEVPELPLRQAFSGNELLLIILGAGMLGLILSEMISPSVPGLKFP